MSMRCKACGQIESKPAEWSGLRDAIIAQGGALAEAIGVQLEWTQPSGEVYQFLSRSLELSTRHNREY